MNKKNKILISLVHNNNKERLLYIKPQIDSLILDLKKKNEVSFFEISWQANLKPINLYIGILRDLIYRKLNREWSNYREIKNRFLLLDVVSFIYNFIKKYIFKPELSQKWFKSSMVEILVTDKHIRGFSIALDSNVDYLLVFEDDTVFLENSIEKLSGLFSSLEINNDLPIYIDLAGGFEINQLYIDKLKLKEDSNFVYYTKPVTNTACCYLVNKKQIEIFCSHIVKNPFLRYLSIDHLINKLFIIQSMDKSSSFCKHASPTFFNHGSVTGQFKPWSR
jgi:hypothetical protein